MSTLGALEFGVVPIVWNNVDLPDLSAWNDSATVLDEIARLGFAGCQHGAGFPEGALLAEELEMRGLGLAEVYCAIDCGVDGPEDGQFEAAVRRLGVLGDGHGDVLVVAIDIAPERSRFAGRTKHASCPRLSERGWDELVVLLKRIAEAVDDAGRRVAFHPHVGTYVENEDECRQLFQHLEGSSVGLCLDVGHWLLAGGDPTMAIQEYGDLIRHIHLKDVDPMVGTDLSAGRLSGFEEALRLRVFTELGSGALDLQGVLRGLDDKSYEGWLMIEQDSSWLRPSESAAVSLHTARFAIKHLVE